MKDFNQERRETFQKPLKDFIFSSFGGRDLITLYFEPYFNYNHLFVLNFD